MPTWLDLHETDCIAKLSLSGAVFVFANNHTVQPHLGMVRSLLLLRYCEIELAADQEPAVHVFHPLSIRSHRLWL